MSQRLDNAKGEYFRTQNPQQMMRDVIANCLDTFILPADL
jgi:hypothetical protein